MIRKGAAFYNGNLSSKYCVYGSRRPDKKLLFTYSISCRTGAGVTENCVCRWFRLLLLLLLLVGGWLSVVLVLSASINQETKRVAGWR